MTATETIYELLRGELTGAWVYLNTYAELFEHPDVRRQQVLELTAPGFFQVVKASLAENILIKVARLMDPAETGKNKNMTFAALFDLGDPALKQAYCSFCSVHYEWKTGNYKPIRDYRNKLSAHIDWKAIQKNPQGVLTRLDDQHWSRIKALFNELWQVLSQVHFCIYKSSLLEPLFDSIHSQPQTIFCHLKSSLFLEELINGKGDNENAEVLRELAEFRYANLGNDPPISLISSKVQPVG